MCFLAVVLLGLISFTRLPINLLPDIAYPKLVVQTTYPGVAPAEVERFVTEPIEREVVAVPGVERVESVSREGVSLVTLRFAWGADMDFALLNVRERLDNLRGQLPERVDRPAVLRTDPAAEPVLTISVSGQGDLWTLKDLAESVIKRRLEQLDGVSEATVTGGLEREIHVDVDPQKLESFGVSMEDVSNALDAANQSAPGGTILRGRFQYSLRTLGELASPAEIAGIVIPHQPDGAAAGGTSAGIVGAGQGSPSGARSPPDSVPAAAQVTLGDIATIEDGFAERQAITRYNGAEAVGLLVYKEAGANTVRVAERVDQVLRQLRAQYPEITLQVASNQAGFIRQAISSVVQNLLQGGVLAFLVLFLFLREPRYPIAVALAIPISVIATFALLNAAGVSLNIMSLGGLALGVGMLVDNSIVVLENIFRHRQLGADQHTATVRGAEEVQGAIISSTLTTIAVFGPIIYVEGIAGQLLGALSFAVAFSLLASIAVALTLLPVMASRWTGTARPLQWKPLVLFERGLARFNAWYVRLLARALDHRGRVVAVSLVLLAIGIFVGMRLDRSVLPTVDEGAFRVRLALPSGTPLATTDTIAARLDSAIRSDSAVDAVFARMGEQGTAAAAAGSTEERGSNIATLDVQVRQGASSAQVVDRLRRSLGAFPAGAVTIETGRATVLGSLLGGGEADLAVRVRGDDQDRALEYARMVEQRLATSDAVTNVHLGVETGHPEILVEIDRDRAAAFGVEPKRIADAVEAYMRGTVATDLVDFDRKVPIVVRLPATSRHSLSTLEQLRVDGIPLRELVHTRETTGPSEILRVNQAPVVPVLADVRGTDLEHALGAVRSTIASVPAPQGIRTEVGGENEEMHRSFRALGFAFVVAFLLMYAILAAEFESLVHPFTVLLSMPLAIVGATVMLWLTGHGINSMSLIGFIILLGIVDNNAVVELDFVLQMREQGMPVREAILAAGHARLRPILMTTATTLLGVLPMALGWGTGASLQAPMAITVLGGLVSATALTFIVIPVAYDLIEEMRVRFGWAREPEVHAGDGSPVAAAGGALSSGAAPEAVVRMPRD